MGTLDGYKVLDLSTLFAGPLTATLLGDHGAEVIKVEHPRGDDLRHWGAMKDDVSLFWKIVSRNKKAISINLNEEEGQNIIKELVKEADVLIENFRPGRMEKWGLGWETLSEINNKLIMARVTGFGQEGPYSSFAGFGTLAESMSGFAHITGEPDGPPTLPPFGLADGITGITGAFAVSSALLEREKSGKGQVIDLALYESLMWILGAHIIEYDQFGTITQRTGNQSTRTCPRNIYQTKDNKWIALSASSESIAKRVFEAIGRPEILDNLKYKTNQDRLQHSDEIDKMINDWTKAHTQEEALTIFREAQAAVSPIYDAEQISNDEHFLQRGSVVEVEDKDFGLLKMQGIFPKFMKTAGEIKHPGPSKIGEDTNEVLESLGMSKEQIEELKNSNVIK